MDWMVFVIVTLLGLQVTNVTASDNVNKNSYINQVFKYLFLLGPCKPEFTGYKCTECDLGFFGFPGCKGKIMIKTAI